MSELIARIKQRLGFHAQTLTYPVLDITLTDGQHLHLVGSIHMGTPGMTPLPDGLLARLEAADALVVEAQFTDRDSLPPITAEQHLLKERLNATDYQTLLTLCRQLGLPEANLQTSPFWQVALTLQASQAQQLGLSPEYGIDHQLLTLAQHSATPVIQLEGLAQQQSLLHSLAKGGQQLLLDTLNFWQENRQQLLKMVSCWESPRPFSALPQWSYTLSPDIQRILLTKRNRDWSRRLRQLPAGHYVVAVGALHLTGQGSLPEQLLHPINMQPNPDDLLLREKS